LLPAERNGSDQPIDDGRSGDSIGGEVAGGEGKGEDLTVRGDWRASVKGDMELGIYKPEDGNIVSCWIDDSEVGPLDYGSICVVARKFAGQLASDLVGIAEVWSVQTAIREFGKYTFSIRP